MIMLYNYSNCLPTLEITHAGSRFILHIASNALQSYGVCKCALHRTTLKVTGYSFMNN